MSIRAMPPFDTPQAPPLGLKVPKAIMVYSVETGPEAIELIFLAGELSAEGGRVIYPNFPGTVEALDDVADRLHELYTTRVKKDADGGKDVTCPTETKKLRPRAARPSSAHAGWAGRSRKPSKATASRPTPP